MLNCHIDTTLVYCLRAVKLNRLEIEIYNNSYIIFKPLNLTELDISTEVEIGLLKSDKPICIWNPAYTGTR